VNWKELEVIKSLFGHCRSQVCQHKPKVHTVIDMGDVFPTYPLRASRSTT